MQRVAVAVSLGIVAALVYWHFSPHFRFQKGFPLRFDKTVHDFGEIQWGTPVEATFRFFNASQQEVTIEHIVESCGCAVARLSSFSFRPGEQGILTVRFFPTGFAGHVTQTLQLRLKGFQTPIILLLRAKVNPLLLPSPSKIDFGRVRSQKQAITTLILKNTSGRKVRITRLETSHEYVKAFTLKDGDEPTIHIALVNPPVGRLYERLYIYTSIPERSQIDVPIQADVACKWQLTDTEFFFGFVNKRVTSHRNQESMDRLPSGKCSCHSDLGSDRSGSIRSLGFDEGKRWWGDKRGCFY